MPRIATRFSGPSLLTNAAVTQFTVASNEKYIVRHIHVQNPTGSTVTLTMSIGTDAAGTRIFDAYSLASGSVLDHFCYYIMAETEIFQAYAGTNNVLTCTIDGDRSVIG